MSEFIDGVLQEKQRTLVYLHQLPFNKLYNAKEPLCNIQGVLYTGADRKYDLQDELGARKLWLAWQKDVQLAAEGQLYKVSEETMKYFQKTKHLTHPPRKGDKNITQTGEIEESMILKINIGAAPIGAVNHPVQDAIQAEVVESNIQIVPYVDGFIPPKFSWSFTALNDFETCPLKCAESRYYKTVKFVETPEIIEGNAIHNQLEKYLLERTPLSSKFVKYQKFADAMLLAAEGGELLVEHEITLNEGLAITGWYGKDAWGRAKLDVAIVKDGVAKIFDWKSGKEKIDEDQLRIFCIFLALERRDIHTFISRYIWLKNDKASAPVTLTRADLMPELKKLLARISRYREAWDNQLWQAKTSGLCKKYCEVVSCSHCGKR